MKYYTYGEVARRLNTTKQIVRYAAQKLEIEPMKIQASEYRQFNIMNDKQIDAIRTYLDKKNSAK